MILGLFMSKKTVVNILLLAVLFCTGCSVRKTQSHAGKRTPEGHLIFFEWVVEGQKKQAALKNGYGMMIFYNAYVKNPVVRYELYVHNDSKIIKTTSLEEFEQEIAQISKGQKLYYYNTCAGGTHHLLDPDILKNIKTFCKEREIIFQEGDDELYTICTCP